MEYDQNRKGKRPIQPNESSSEEEKKPPRKKVEVVIPSNPKVVKNDYESILGNLNINDESSDKPKKRRLYVGDGDFSGSLAMANKHPEAAEGIHATSYEESDHELFKEGSEAAKNIQELRKMGAEVSHGIDATKLGEYTGQDGKLGTEKFDKAYFHHPRDSKRVGGLSGKALSHGFAASARDILKEDGKIHLSIPSSETYDKEGKKQRPQATRNTLYGKALVKDTESLGYKLDGKRGGIKDRYGEHGYSHTKTGKQESLDNLVSREFVFRRRKDDESVDSSPEEYSEITTGSETESTASQEKRREEKRQQSQTE